ncbi:MAG TPA: hypothetical protein VJK72_00410 [Candidatus Nanoarchaeia archaeon]|nr:hypothetical protein [Candidatus Nanoarchaeia archaeon]
MSLLQLVLGTELQHTNAIQTAADADTYTRKPAIAREADIEMALADISTTQVEPYIQLGRRIDQIRWIKKRPIDVVQVAPLIDAISEFVASRYPPKVIDARAREFARRVLDFADANNDSHLLVYTLSLWFTYIHQKTVGTQKKETPLFLRVLYGSPRLEYETIDEATEDCKRIAGRLGTRQFEKNIQKRYFDLL